jgi:hypothetical protein
MEPVPMVLPHTVKSPKARWTLIDVLVSTQYWALALGEWDGDRVLASRWNGNGDEPGNPMSRGIPTWFVLPDEFIDHLLPLVPADKRPLADALLKRAA